MPQRANVSSGRIAVGPLTARAVTIKSVEDTIRKDVESTVKKQLALSGALPVDVKEVIDSAARAAAATSIELAVTRATEEAATDIGRMTLLDRFDDKIKVAAGSLTHISQSGDVDQILERRSELLAKKRAALVAAGFSDDQAMQVLLADIAARAH
jgi:hypothetical protein